MQTINFLKPSRDNIKNYSIIGSFLVLVSLIDVISNAFLKINLTSFLPGSLTTLFPLIIGLIGLNMGVDCDTPIEKTQHYEQVLNHFDNNKSKVGKRYRRVFNEDLGTESLLDPVFDFYREAFLDLVVRTPRWINTINATEGGSLFGKRIKNMRFVDFLGTYKN